MQIIGKDRLLLQKELPEKKGEKKSYGCINRSQAVNLPKGGGRNMYVRGRTTVAQEEV